MTILPGFISKALEREFVKHPWFPVLLLLVCGGGGTVAFNPFVLADHFQDFENDMRTRVRDLEVGVCENNIAIQESSLKDAIRSMDAEIFQLERVDLAGEATDRDLKRLSQLKTQRHELDVELGKLPSESDCEKTQNGGG